ncbi:MAG: hypothetical protein PGN16_06395 [Sphingomonas phyllosphaerae]|uniref:hypothetical protein n=1 Tax=Sphingomonas phyllosphaerae TaxID=257003 RepID=UPI002FF4E12D
MKVLIATAMVLSASAANAQASAQAYPSCDLKAQRALKGEVGGLIKDPRQAHVSVRANILEADLSTARKARRLTQAATDQLYRRVEAVRTGTNRYTKAQGFLSAGELASFDRELDAIAMDVCRRAAPQPQAANESDSDYLQHRAASLNKRIDAAIKGRHATRQEAAKMHLAVGQVQTEAGHLQAVNGTIDRADADRMNQRLTDVERALTHQP